MMSGDLFFDIDFGRMLAFHEKKKAAATLFVHPNGHPYDSDLLVLDEDTGCGNSTPSTIPGTTGMKIV